MPFPSPGRRHITDGQSPISNAPAKEAKGNGVFGIISFDDVLYLTGNKGMNAPGTGLPGL
ncbi:hypothetical protein [Desulfobacter curvatus]|uniref:hypothetical protein n=1 Tax=Desulfobacter curvatus TaxID=2290 RepID=UPI0003618C3C|nr:hypothetical protein [Desulfobacter curvatus]